MQIKNGCIEMESILSVPVRICLQKFPQVAPRRGLIGVPHKGILGRYISGVLGILLPKFGFCGNVFFIFFSTCFELLQTIHCMMQKHPEILQTNRIQIENVQTLTESQKSYMSVSVKNLRFSSNTMVFELLPTTLSWREDP